MTWWYILPIDIVKNDDMCCVTAHAETCGSSSQQTHYLLYVTSLWSFSALAALDRLLITLSVCQSFSQSVTQTTWTLYRSQFYTNLHQTCHQGRVPGNVITCCFWWGNERSCWQQLNTASNSNHCSSCYQQWLVGNVPSTWHLRWNSPKYADFDQYLLMMPQPKKLAKNVQLSRIKSRKRVFQLAIDGMQSGFFEPPFMGLMGWKTQL